MLSPGNVATPATGATVVVPERVPLPGFAPSAIVDLQSTRLNSSHLATSYAVCSASEIAAPATVLLGWTLKLCYFAGPLRVLHSFPTRRSSDLALTVSV